MLLHTAWCANKYFSKATASTFQFKFNARLMGLSSSHGSFETHFICFKAWSSQSSTINCRQNTLPFISQSIFFFRKGSRNHKFATSCFSAGCSTLLLFTCYLRTKWTLNCMAGQQKNIHFTFGFIWFTRYLAEQLQKSMFFNLPNVCTGINLHNLRKNHLYQSFGCNIFSVRAAKTNSLVSK